MIVVAGGETDTGEFWDDPPTHTLPWEYQPGELGATPNLTEEQQRELFARLRAERGSRRYTIAAIGELVTEDSGVTLSDDRLTRLHGNYHRRFAADGGFAPLQPPVRPVLDATLPPHEAFKELAFQEPGREIPDEPARYGMYEVMREHWRQKDSSSPSGERLRHDLVTALRALIDDDLARAERHRAGSEARPRAVLDYYQ
jgi:hypothetical protein